MQRSTTIRNHRSGGHVRRRLLASAALITGAAYLTWRTGWTLGAPWWVALPLLAAEALFFLRFVLLVGISLPEPAGGDPAAVTTASVNAPSVELLVPAATAGRDDLTRTLSVLGRAGAERVRVLDRIERRTMRREAERLGATYEVHDADPATGSAGLVEAARVGARAEVLAWVDAGDVIVPGFLDLAPMLTDATRPRVAVVQSATDLVNSDSLVHLRPDHDERAFANEVAGPSLSRSGAAPWTGSGSLFRSDALESVGGIADHAVATHRAAARLARAGWSVRWSTPPLVRTVAPDTLSEHLFDVGRTASGDWSQLIGRDAPLRPGGAIPLRRRVEQLHASTAVLDGVSRLTLLAVLTATLISGRMPFDGPLVAMTLATALQLGLRTVAVRALGRGTTALGDPTRQGLRRMGVHVVGVLRPPAPPDDDTRGGFAVLGRLRLLTSALVAVDLALVLRGLTFLFPDLLPRFTTAGRFVTMGAAVWAIVAMVDVLQLLVGRVQRRDDHRNSTDLVARLDGAACRVVDLTPHGIGLLVPSPTAANGRIEVGLDIPRLDGTTTSLDLRARVRHVSTFVDAETGRYRAGASFRDLDDTARDALIEFCALTAEQRDAGRLEVATATPEELAVTGTGRVRRAFAAANVVALLLAGAVVTAGPVSAAPLAGGTATINGRVLGPDGAPVPGACVWTSQGPTSVWSVADDATGRFTLSGLADGTYQLAAQDCSAMAPVVMTYSGSTIWSSQASAYTVEGQDVVSADDIRLHAAGQVDGQVVTATGDPAASVCVSVVATTPDGHDEWRWVGVTDAAGRYSGAVPADLDGRLQYRDCGAPSGVDTWYPGSTDRNAAATVSVEPGATRTLGTVTMVAGSVVHGRILDDTGRPAERVCISAQIVDDRGWTWSGGATTDADGTYRFVLPSGRYSLWIQDCGSGEDLVTQWYPGASADTRPPPTVEVNGSDTTFDATMSRGGRAAGTAVDEDGRPAAGACVSLHPYESPDRGVSWEQVAPDGTWQSSPVPPGRYVVRYSNCDGGTTWVDQLHPEVRPGSGRPWSMDDVAAVTVSPGQVTRVAGDSLVHAARVHGTVASAGRGVGGVCIGGVTGDDDARRSGADGTWSASVYPGADTTISFSDCVPGRGLVQQTRTVHGVGGQDQRVDVDLAGGATSSVAGSVVDDAGSAPANQVCVVAYRPDNLIGMGMVGPDGTFHVDGLADGDYWFGIIGCDFDSDGGTMIRFPGDGPAHPPIWYGGGTIDLGTSAPDPARQGVPLTEVRSAAPTAPLDVCIDGGCPTRTPATTPASTPVGGSASGSEAGRAADPPGAPSAAGATSAPPDHGAAPPAPGGPLGGLPTAHRFRRTALPIIPRRPLGPSGPTATASGSRSPVTSGVPVSQPATTQAAAQGPDAPSTSAPTPATDSARDLGTPVAARELLPSVPMEHRGFAWDLLGGTVLAAGAAIGLILAWRRRHPNFG